MCVQSKCACKFGLRASMTSVNCVVSAPLNGRPRNGERARAARGSRPDNDRGAVGAMQFSKPPRRSAPVSGRVMRYFERPIRMHWRPHVATTTNGRVTKHADSHSATLLPTLTPHILLRGSPNTRTFVFPSTMTLFNYAQLEVYLTHALPPLLNKRLKL